MRLQEHLEPVCCLHQQEDKAANEQEVISSHLQRASAAVIHSPLNLNLNLNRLVKLPAVQMEKKRVENVCRSRVFFQESASYAKRHQEGERVPVM